MGFLPIWGCLPRNGTFQQVFAVPRCRVLLSRQQRSAGRQAGVGDEAVFSTTIDITGAFSYTVISLFRALNAKW